MEELPTDVPSLAKWMKAARLERGWSTTDLANVAREIAHRSGSTMKLKQQSVSGFEQGGAQRIPEWFRYVREALEGNVEPQTAPEAGHRSDRPEQPSTVSAESGETIPLTSLDLSLSMGPGTPIEDFVESEPVEFDLGLLRVLTRSPYHRLRMLRGIGTSMEPKFYTGDRFLIDTTVRDLSRLDGYYWITFDGAHGLKKLRPAGGGRVHVISESEPLNPMTVERAELTIEGRAIWFSREL